LAKSFVDELVEFPAQTLRAIGTDEVVLKLLTNNPDLDLDSDEADEVFDKYLFDYGYVDSTTQEAEAYIMVEAEIDSRPTETVRNMNLYVTVMCHKKYMKLDGEKFPGLIGNRRENLVRHIDRLLNGSTMFGVGKLTLESIRVVPAPSGFTAREITYKIPDIQRREISFR